MTGTLDRVPLRRLRPSTPERACFLAPASKTGRPLRAGARGLPGRPGPGFAVRCSARATACPGRNRLRGSVRRRRWPLLAALRKGLLFDEKLVEGLVVRHALLAVDLALNRSVNVLVFHEIADRLKRPDRT